MEMITRSKTVLFNGWRELARSLESQQLFFDAMQASYWRPQKVVSSGLDKDHQIGDDVARKQTEARWKDRRPCERNRRLKSHRDLLVFFFAFIKKLCFDMLKYRC